MSDFDLPAVPGSIRYEIDLTVDDSKLTYSARQVLQFQVSTSDAIHALSLDIGRLKLADLQCEQGDLQPAEEASAVVLTLTQALKPGAVAYLVFTYMGSLPFYEPEQPDYYAFLDWYPHLSQPHHGSYRICLAQARDYQVLSSGLQSGDCFEGSIIRKFGLLLSKTLRLRQILWQDVSVGCLYYPGNEAFVETLFSKTVRALEFFNRFIGAYPLPTFQMCPGVEIYRGGDPIASGMVAFHGFQSEDCFDQDFWIVGHEIGHQYWGENVLAPYYNHWLWIGLGLSCDRELSIKHGDGVYHHFARILAKATAEGRDIRLNPPQEVARQLTKSATPEFDWNTAVRHARSVELMIALQERVGKSRFFDTLRAIQHDYPGKVLTVEAFVGIMQCLDASTEAIFEQYGI